MIIIVIRQVSHSVTWLLAFTLHSFTVMTHGEECHCPWKHESCARVVAFLVRPVDATYFACLLADNGLEGSLSGTDLLCVPAVEFWWVCRLFVRFFDCLEMLNNTQTPLTSASAYTPTPTSTAPAMTSLGRTTITTPLPKTMVAVLALTTQIVFVKVLLSYFVVYIYFSTML